LWYKTNVAVYQPDLEGVSLSPTGDYGFLRQVHRAAQSSLQSHENR
jgi:hypothetical protein